MMQATFSVFRLSVATIFLSQIRTSGLRIRVGDFWKATVVLRVVERAAGNGPLITSSPAKIGQAHTARHPTISRRRNP